MGPARNAGKKKTWPKYSSGVGGTLRVRKINEFGVNKWDVARAYATASFFWMVDRVAPLWAGGVRRTYGATERYN